MAFTGEQKRAYQLRWIKARRDKWIAENGPCALCGSSDSLEVDHIIRRMVGGGLVPSQIWSRSEKVRLRELAKCQVLCGKCHLAKSNDEKKTKLHGATMYRNGCRCFVCRESQRLRMRRLRATTKAKQVTT